MKTNAEALTEISDAVNASKHCDTERATISILSLIRARNALRQMRLNEERIQRENTDELRQEEHQNCPHPLEQRMTGILGNVCMACNTLLKG